MHLQDSDRVSSELNILMECHCIRASSGVFGPSLSPIRDRILSSTTRMVGFGCGPHADNFSIMYE